MPYHIVGSTANQPYCAWQEAIADYNTAEKLGMQDASVCNARALAWTVLPPETVHEFLWGCISAEIPQLHAHASQSCCIYMPLTPNLLSQSLDRFDLARVDLSNAITLDAGALTRHVLPFSCSWRLQLAT